jgi:hypothetical protein
MNEKKNAKQSLEDAYPETFWVIELGYNTLNTVAKRLDEAREALKNPEIKALVLACGTIQETLGGSTPADLKGEGEIAVMARTMALALFLKDFLERRDRENR